MRDLKNSIVLIVEDNPLNTELLIQAMGNLYSVYSVDTAGKAFDFFQKNRPDLILLDIMLPDMDGYEVCRKLKSNPETTAIPIIFISAMNDIKSKTKGFELGAVDYITKPFHAAEIKARVYTHISLAHANYKLANYNVMLEEKVKKRTDQLLDTQDMAIEALASLAEYRDPETGGHIKRTKEYIKTLAVSMKEKAYEKFSLSDRMIDALYKSAPLHDIGKVAIPDRILLKEGPLSHNEYEIMKKHTVYGRDSLIKAEEKLGRRSFLAVAKDIAYTHQEKWNGSGYPLGLKGEEIPVSGRLMAIADVYDALISKRVYKPPYPHEKAVNLISQLKGIHFDPEITDVFLSVNESFKRIAYRFADFEEEKNSLVF